MLDIVYYHQMKDDNQSHIELFARLSKILADTFQDIHHMCLSSLSEMGVHADHPGLKKVPAKQSEAKKKWLERKEEAKFVDAEVEESDENVEEVKQTKYKAKKMKVLAYGDDPASKDKKIEKKKKVAKWEQEGKPRPPLNAFMLFLRDSKFEIMEAKPELTPSEVSSYASGLWNELAEEEKQKYRNQYKVNRAKYDDELKSYNERERASLSSPIAQKQKQGLQVNGQKKPKDILDSEFLHIQEQSQNSDSISVI